MAELHCKALFDGSGLQMSVADRKELGMYPALAMCTPLEQHVIVNRVLQNVSQQLESLEALSGMQSFFLVVNPNDHDDNGFLGGTTFGREFWRGHRGCGAAGAELFKAKCIRSTQSLCSPHPGAVLHPTLQPVPLVPGTSSRKKGPARELKTELYGAVRDALRCVPRKSMYLLR